MKTEIVLSDDLLMTISRTVGKTGNYSEFVNNILRRYFTRTARSNQENRDLEILNQNSEYLNHEAEDVLAYQVML
ncbi:hypothetical protein KKH56_02710 [bacterium]|nr:hypothetical protein [bacterium]